MTEPARTGARRMADIPPDVLKRINAGEIETITLVEWLATDMAALMRAAFPELPPTPLKRLRNDGLGILDKTRLAGEILYDHLGIERLGDVFAHRSDVVRGWGAQMVALHPYKTLGARLKAIEPLADDPNPGARETAWIMLRPHIAENLGDALEIFKDWVVDDRANIRRYASEITRPRGVWCPHMRELKENPARALHLLAPLAADPSRYVQNSVANWLNDAAKSHPAWVQKTCAGWQKKNKGKETTYIVRRALRSM